MFSICKDVCSSLDSDLHLVGSFEMLTVNIINLGSVAKTHNEVNGFIECHFLPTIDKKVFFITVRMQKLLFDWLGTS